MKKFLLVLVVIVIVLSCVFLGYYMLDSFGILSANSVDTIDSDNWNVIVETNEPTIIGSSVVSSTEVKKTDIKVNGTLKNQEDTITYDLKIKNNGSIDAYLYSITSNNDDLDVKCLNGEEELKSGLVLEAGEAINTKMIVRSKKDDSYDFNLEVQLVFNQYKK